MHKYFFILVISLMVVLGQVLIKIGLNRYEWVPSDKLSTFFSSLLSWEFLGAIGLYLISLYMYISMLKRVQLLDIFFPTQIFVIFFSFLASFFILKEAITLQKTIGMIIAVLGLLIFLNSK